MKSKNIICFCTSIFAIFSLSACGSNKESNQTYDGRVFDISVNQDKSLTATNKKDGNNYSLEISGKGRAKEPEIRSWFESYNEVEFAGYQENPYPYVKNADYLVQLSDDESWCNSITEAKLLDVPVVVTNFESAYEQVEDGINGILVDLDTIDYSSIIDKMLDNKYKLKDNLKGFKFDNEINKWLDILK